MDLTIIIQLNKIITKREENLFRSDNNVISIFKALKLKMFYQNNLSPTYFGISDLQLDIETMRYRMFGAKWKFHNGYRYILEYWFGDDQTELINNVNNSNLKNHIHKNEQISEVYQAIRVESEKRLWNKRIKLSNHFHQNEKWENRKPGWYITKSDNSFPCTITCFQKIKNSIWIEHICICENLNDIKKYINLINFEHNVSLKIEE